MVVRQQNRRRLAQAAELRARAERTRGHARALTNDPAVPRLQQYADELDASAEAVESAAQNCEDATHTDEDSN